MRRGIGALLAALALGLVPAAAQGRSRAVVNEYNYGPGPEQFVKVYHGGPATVLVLHENGQTWKTVRGTSETLQGLGFTALDVEWEDVSEKGGSQIWGPLTAQIEAAVQYATAHSEELMIDPGRIAMLGGSRGANLALLTSLNMNAATPGTIKAVVALSGDVNPMAQIARAEEAIARQEEPNPEVVKRLSRTYGCKGGVQKCPLGYVEEWSPYAKVVGPFGASAPAMLLAASMEEHRTAAVEDQQPMAEALGALGIPAVVVTPQNGHGFGFMASVRKAVFAFLEEHDVD